MAGKENGLDGALIGVANGVDRAALGMVNQGIDQAVNEPAEKVELIILEAAVGHVLLLKDKLMACSQVGLRHCHYFSYIT